MALAFLVNLLTARYLGPSNYGLVNYAALYTAFFTSFATLGLSSLLLKDFMDDPEGTGTTVGTAIAMRLLSSTLSAVSILAIVAAVDRGERLTMTVVALYSMSLIFQAFDTIQYWFQSRLESKCEGKQKYLTPLYIGSALVNVALNFLLIPCWGATGAAVASLLTQISTTFVFPLLLRPLRPNGLLMCQAVLLRDVFPKRKKTDNSQRKAC